MHNEQKTPEQKARELLERMDVYEPQRLADGTILELSDLIASHERLLEALQATPALVGLKGGYRELLYRWWKDHGKPAIDKAWKPNDAK